MTGENLRRSARAIILDDDDNVLLCRLDLTGAGGPVVWVTPGGGVEPGESSLVAVHRELHEEVGLRLDHDPPLVWHEEARGPKFAPGFDGVRNDHFLVRTASFRPRGAWTDEQLAAEHITSIRWWTVSEILAHAGPEVFGPRDLGARLAALLTDGPPAVPVQIRSTVDSPQ